MPSQDDGMGRSQQTLTISVTSMLAYAGTIVVTAVATSLTAYSFLRGEILQEGDRRDASLRVLTEANATAIGNLTGIGETMGDRITSLERADFGLQGEIRSLIESQERQLELIREGNLRASNFENYAREILTDLSLELAEVKATANQNADIPSRLLKLEREIDREIALRKTLEKDVADLNVMLRETRKVIQELAPTT